MHINNLPKEFEDARSVMQQIEQAGFEAYFVGGSVRDTILGLPIHDVDIASSAYPAEIKSIFNKTIDTGIEHGTVMVMDHKHSYEITTFRTESGYQDYRRPDKVTFVRSLEEDLKRRDFTINALAMRENGDVIDLFHGIDDLHAKIIKAVGDANVRFNEDALRMMRAVRFASKLDFRIEENTFKAIKRHSKLLAKIAVERIHEEFVKMMLGQDPCRGIKDMIETNLTDYVPMFKEHIDSLEQISKLKHLELKNEVAVWGLLSYQFGFNKNDISKFLKAWKSANEIIKSTQLVNEALISIEKNTVDSMLVYRTGIDDMMVANQIAIQLGHADLSQQINLLNDRLAIHSKHDLKTNGKVLIKAGVVKPGPQLGQILKELETKVVSGKINNTESDLLEAAQNLKN